MPAGVDLSFSREQHLPMLGVWSFCMSRNVESEKDGFVFDSLNKEILRTLLPSISVSLVV